MGDGAGEPEEEKERKWDSRRLSPGVCVCDTHKSPTADKEHQETGTQTMKAAEEQAGRGSSEYRAGREGLAGDPPQLRPKLHAVLPA